MSDIEWKRSLRASGNGSGPFVTGKASATGTVDSISHHRTSIEFRTSTLGKSTTGGLAGASGDPPKRPNGFDKSNTGHYAPDIGPFQPLPRSMMFQMADPSEKRRQAPEPRPGSGRPRANSMPSLNGNTEFYSTFRSVMTNGILSQTDMRDKGISFNPSHDGRLRDARHIEVTRMPGNQSSRDALSIMQSDVSRQAVTNEHHGALSVVLERSQPLQTREATVHDLSFDDRMQLLRAPSGYEDAMRNVMLAQHGRELTGNGPDDARRRMHSSFMVVSNASSPSAQTVAHEETRPSITPPQIGQMLVPIEHASTANQVIRDLRVRNGTIPPVQFVHSSTEMSPQYRTRAGNLVNINGLEAPAYHHAVTSHANRHGDTDIHIVKTGLSQGHPQGPVQTRPRSKSF